MVKKCKILMYADHTVLFYGDKDSTAIQEVLTNEANRVASWIREKFVLYGAHQKLSRMSKCEITINNSVINESSAYYLGVTLDNHLTLQEHVNNIYRKCSARVKLLSRVRQNMGPYIASTINTTMIRPITLYCYPVLLGISNTLNDKLESIQEVKNEHLGSLLNLVTFNYKWTILKQYENAGRLWMFLNQLTILKHILIVKLGLRDLFTKKTLEEMHHLLNSQKSVHHLERNLLPIRGL